MIRKILTTYAARLDEYLARSHRQPEGVAEVGLIGSAGEQCPNKLVVSLVNLEREASGDGGYMQRAATGYAGRRQPLLLNMHIMMAAVYEDKRYAEALSVLSDALTFVQSLPRFEVGNESYTLELVPMSTTDLHNIWTTMGGQYYPSFICKVRGLTLNCRHTSWLSIHPFNDLPPCLARRASTRSAKRLNFAAISSNASF